MMKKYIDIEMPEQYWMLHHIMPESIMYLPSYLLAAVRAAELEKKLKNYTEKLVGIRRSRKIFKKNDEGWSNINLKEFSKLESRVFLKEITQ
jgi:hypothetical protein